MTDLDLHMPLVPKPCALIYPTHTEVQQYTNVLLIDASIQEYQQFIDSANADTFPIVYSSMSSKTDLLELLKTTFTNISRLGLVFHSSSSGDAIMFLDSEPLFVADEVNANQQFIKDIINEFQIKNIDYLACDTLNYPAWTNYYDSISQGTGVIVGASNDKTGNIKYGGDWVLETTSENVELIYFTQSIEYYKYLLATPVTFTDSIGIAYTSNVDGTSCYVSSNITTLSGNIVIPDKVTNNNITYNVTGIGNFAFLECASLTSITIPNSVTSIGNNAFEACTGLKTVIFMDQNRLTSIGTELFKNDVNIFFKNAPFHHSALPPTTPTLYPTYNLKPNPIS
jgi:hypothetical protein